MKVNIEEIKEIFTGHSEIELRTKKGKFGDTLYHGLFAKTLLNEWGLDKNDLKEWVDREILIKLAFDSIINGFKEGKPLTVNLDDFPKELRSMGASFVSIKKSGSMRGAMGSIIPNSSLLQDIATNAFLAAFPATIESR